jgi:hypothetical protein
MKMKCPQCAKKIDRAEAMPVVNPTEKTKKVIRLVMFPCNCEYEIKDDFTLKKTRKFFDDIERGEAATKALNEGKDRDS